MSPVEKVIFFCPYWGKKTLNKQSSRVNILVFAWIKIKSGTFSSFDRGFILIIYTEVHTGTHEAAL